MSLGKVFTLSEPAVVTSRRQVGSNRLFTGASTLALRRASTRSTSFTEVTAVAPRKSFTRAAVAFSTTSTVVRGALVAGKNAVLPQPTTVALIKELSGQLALVSSMAVTARKVVRSSAYAIENVTVLAWRSTDLALSFVSTILSRADASTAQFLDLAFHIVAASSVTASKATVVSLTAVQASLASVIRWVYRFGSDLHRTEEEPRPNRVSTAHTQSRTATSSAIPRVQRSNKSDREI